MFIGIDIAQEQHIIGNPWRVTISTRAPGPSYQQVTVLNTLVPDVHGPHDEDWDLVQLQQLITDGVTVALAAGTPIPLNSDEVE